MNNLLTGDIPKTNYLTNWISSIIASKQDELTHEKSERGEEIIVSNQGGDSFQFRIPHISYQSNNSSINIFTYKHLNM